MSQLFKMLKQIWWVLVLLTIYSASLLDALDNLVSPHRSILDIIINSSQTNGLIMDIIEQSLFISTMFHNW